MIDGDDRQPVKQARHAPAISGNTTGQLICRAIGDVGAAEMAGLRGHFVGAALPAQIR
jgi:hypothetical protein